MAGTVICGLECRVISSRGLIVTGMSAGGLDDWVFGEWVVQWAACCLVR